MLINVSAVGNLKKYLNNEDRRIDVPDKTSISSLKELLGIPKSISVVSIVNSVVADNKYLLQDQDSVVFLVLFSAG